MELTVRKNILTVLMIGSVQSCFRLYDDHSENKEVDTSREGEKQTNFVINAGNPTSARDVEYNVLPTTLNENKQIPEHEGVPSTSNPKDIPTPSEKNVIDEEEMKRQSISQKPRSSKHKKKKEKRASIHVIPEIKSKYPLPESFDGRGNINGKWIATSTHSKMELFIDSPKSKSYYNVAYIRVKRRGNYFIYGQVFFHGDNHEMAHCLHVADSYKPCVNNTCYDRKVMCSRSAPGHPETVKNVQNINTNYIGGVVYLQKGSTIRLAIDVDLNINKKEAIELDKSMCYFGAFAV